MKTIDALDGLDDGDTAREVHAEQAVIGALLRDNGGVDRMGTLVPAQFLRHDHRLIFTELMRQIGAGGADVISVGMALGESVANAMPYLNDMAQSCPSAANIARYADLVRDRALRRALLAALGEVSVMANSPGNRSALQMLDEAQGLLATLAETRTEREPVHISAAMVPYMAQVEARLDGEVGMQAIATGFDELDALLNGGLNRGSLLVVGARPSVGKTALAVNIADHAARTVTVLVLSMEMVLKELIDRQVAALGSVHLGRVAKPELLDEAEWRQYRAGSEAMAKLHLHMDDQPALSLLQVRNKARRVKRTHGLDLLVIDYLQLMSGDGSNRDNRNAQIEAISRGLKGLAKELDIGVIALSQLNRAAAGKARPQLSDLRDSGAIEQDADIVVFVQRDEVDNPATHMKGFAELIVAKNRQGSIGDVLVEYEGRYTRFKNTTRRRPLDPAAKRGRGGPGLAAHL